MTSFHRREPDQWLDLGHVTLPYWKVGSGPDLVFVHGWPLHAATWRHVVPHLADRFTCHLFDLQGAGLARDGASTRYGISDFIDSVVAVAERVVPEDRPIGWVGHDSGGAFARVAAARLPPARHAGTALGNTEIPGYTSPVLSQFFAMGRRKRLRRLGRHVMRTEAGAVWAMKSTIRDRDLLAGEFRELFLEPMCSSSASYQRTFALVDHLELSDFDMLADAHAAIEAPVHMIWGSSDPWFPLAPMRENLTSFQGPTSVSVIERGRLFVHEEYPERFARECAEHFDRCFA